MLHKLFCLTGFHFIIKTKHFFRDREVSWEHWILKFVKYILQLELLLDIHVSDIIIAKIGMELERSGISSIYLQCKQTWSQLHEDWRR